MANRPKPPEISTLQMMVLTAGVFIIMIYGLHHGVRNGTYMMLALVGLAFADPIGRRIKEKAPRYFLLSLPFLFVVSLLIYLVLTSQPWHAAHR